MKVLLICLSVVGLSFAAFKVDDHLKAPVNMMRKACVAESGVDEKYILESKNGYIADVPELGCYILCMWQHAGMIADDGSIYFDQIIHLLTKETKETVQYVSDECKTKFGDTECKTAWLTMKCFLETAPEGAELP